MKKLIKPLVAACVVAIAIASCKKDAKTPDTTDNQISQQTIAQIQKLGFSTQSVTKVDEGYLVEGDIVLTDELLNSTPQSNLLRAGQAEQYRTTNLVTGLPRTITVKVTNLGTAFIQGADLAISRYNALGERIKFQRITSGTPSITIKGFNQGPSGGY